MISKFSLAILVIAVVVVGGVHSWREPDAPVAHGEAAGEVLGRDQALTRAIEARGRDVAVQGQGTVIRILADDVRGSRHQRFILRIAPGTTILIAHNIDLAPRVPELKAGDLVSFSGEYVWNEKGGVVHWTHHDPGGGGQGGWLRHAGKLYR